MSQATLIGLCSDNVVTILQPSSTIECPDTYAGMYVDISSNSGDFNNPLSISVLGTAFITGTITNPGLGTSTTVTIGDFTVTSTASIIPFQTFITVAGSVYLTVTGSGTYTYSYTVYKLQ